MKFEKATQEEMSNTSGSGKRGSPKWPLSEMGVGDATEITIGQYGKSHPQIYAAVFGKQSGKKFGTRKVGDNVYRVWRIS